MVLRESWKPAGRHSGNYLVEDNGAVHSMDNGESFTGIGFNGRSFSDRLGEIDPLLKTPEGRKIMDRIQTYGNNPSFRAEIEKYLGPKDADQMIGRINLLINYYARVGVQSHHGPRHRINLNT